MLSPAARLLAVPALLISAGCTNATRDFHDAPGVLQGRAVKGPIAGSRVSVTPALVRDLLADGVTDDQGQFIVELGIATGDLRACATNGAYVEEATGTLVELETTELCAAVPAFTLSERREVVITPWTDWALARAQALVQYGGHPWRDAVEQARREVDAFLTCGNPDLSLIDVEPADATSEEVAGLELTPALLSGVLLAGLSHQAKMISEKQGLTPGVAITALTLTRAFGDDLRADGGLDGETRDGRLVLDGYLLGPDSLRGAQEGFAQGVRGFLLSPRNATSLAPFDLQALLACIATSESPLFPEDPAGTLDVNGPAIEVLAPTEGSTVAGNVPVHIAASDVSDIDDLWLDDGPGLMGQSRMLSGRTAELVATFDTMALADGDYTFNAHGLDILGNSSRKSFTVSINNNAPVIDVRSPTTSDVSDQVTVVAVATDPQGVASLDLTAPNLPDTDPDPARFEAMWDTTALLDGPAALQFGAVDVEGNMATATRPVVVNNLLPGSIEVTGYVDTPVEDITIEVLGMTGGGQRDKVLVTNQGSALGSTFSAEMPDTYAGPILIRGYGADAHYTDAATTLPVSFSAGDELLLLTEYTPSAAGTVLPPLSLNALTTLGAHAGLARWRAGMAATDAVALGNRLVAEHLQRPQPVDLLSAPVSDFTGDPIADALESQKVGLLHAGLAELGRQWSEEAALPSGALPTIAMLRHLKADLGDGVLNGLDAQAQAIVVTDTRSLGTNTFRSEVALAMVDWLESAQNVSSLEPGNFTQTGGMLDLMASNTSELFGPELPVSFDIFGPSMTLTQPADGQAVAGSIAIVATASDPSGVQLILPYIDYQVSPAVGPDLDTGAAGFSAALDTTQLTDGSHNLRLVAVDTRDNIAIHDYTIIVDNSPPLVTISAPSLTGQTVVMVDGTLDDPHSGVVSLELFVDAVSDDLVNDPGSVYSRTVTVSCNASSTVTAVATNATGLTGMDSVTVGCDDRAPTVDLSASTYWPTSSLSVTYDEPSSEYVYSPMVGPQPTELHLLDWTGMGPVLEKFVNRLDAASENLPELLLVPDDFGQAGTNVGSPSADMTVEYRYYADAILVTDWQTIPYSGSAGGFLVPLSYAALGPQLADSTGMKAQQIVVRATDPQGNSDQRAFNFRMQVSSPPVFYADCDLGYLEGRTLASDTLHEWFSLDDPWFFSGELIFPRFEPASLAPWSFDVQIDPVSVTFEELGRSEIKTTSPLASCQTTPNPQDWCTSSNNGASADPSCWVQVPDKEMYRLLSTGDPSICWDNLWPLGPPASVTPSLSTNTFPGSADLVPPWVYDSIGGVWRVPDAYLRSPTSQPAQFLMRTNATRPQMDIPDAAGPPFAWMQTTKHGGGFGYYVRSHNGIELVRQWDGFGLDFHWSREFEAREYVQSLRITAPRPPVSIIIQGVGFANLEALPASGCGGDIVRTLTE